MKTSTLLTAGLFLLLASRSVTATAADPRLSNGYSTAPNRGLFGLPMPQQWSGSRTTGTGYNAGYNTTGYNANCPNGNCQTGYRGQTGYAGQNSSCANGQCATGACADGQCPPGACASGQCATGNCPNGNCGVGGYTNNRMPMGAPSGWSPRSSRTGLADPYRRSGDVSDREGWTQRAQRPVLAPVDDAFNSRYRREELNLRDEYFGRESDADYGYRSQSQSRSRTNSSDWDRASQRSMEVPADNFNGVARF
jgi:hypothetical protein